MVPPTHRSSSRSSSSLGASMPLVWDEPEPPAAAATPVPTPNSNSREARIARHAHLEVTRKASSLKKGKRTKQGEKNNKQIGENNRNEGAEEEEDREEGEEDGDGGGVGVVPCIRILFDAQGKPCCPHESAMLLPSLPGAVALPLVIPSGTAGASMPGATVTGGITPVPVMPGVPLHPVRDRPEVCLCCCCVLCSCLPHACAVRCVVLCCVLCGVLCSAVCMRVLRCVCGACLCQSNVLLHCSFDFHPAQTERMAIDRTSQAKEIEIAGWGGGEARRQTDTDQKETEEHRDGQEERSCVDDVEVVSFVGFDRLCLSSLLHTHSSSLARSRGMFCFAQKEVLRASI